MFVLQTPGGGGWGGEEENIKGAPTAKRKRTEVRGSVAEYKRLQESA